MIPLLCLGLISPSADPAAAAVQALTEVMSLPVSWEELHAAEALIDSGRPEPVQSHFEADAETAPAPYRTAIWRLLAEATPSEQEKTHWTDKIVAVLLDPAASDRVTAVEGICKLHYRLGPRGLAVVREIASEQSQPEALFGVWALAVAGEPGALARLTAALASTDPATRARASSALRWLRPSDPDVLRAVARAAHAESSDSSAFLSIVVTALILKADPTHEATWRNELESALRAGPARRRWEACQGLMLEYGPDDLPSLAPYLDTPQADNRTGAASVILHILRQNP